MQMTRRGRMMVVTLDDGTAQVDVSVYAELLEKQRERIREDSLLFVQGKVLRDEFTAGLRIAAEELLDLAAVRRRYAARLRLEINGQADARRLMQTLAPYRTTAEGACPVLVHYENGAASCDVELGEAWKVLPDEPLIGELSTWLAPQNVQVVYGDGIATG
jgi:DNA polymerase-3 subunit alpha